MKYEYNINERQALKYVRNIFGPLPKNELLRTLNYAAAVKAFLAHAKDGDTCYCYEVPSGNEANSVWKGGFHITKQIAEKLFQGEFNKPIEDMIYEVL